jgi:hypothetical protein
MPPASPRLLFDENLAAGLVRRLADVYPGSTHVKLLGLMCSAPDSPTSSLSARTAPRPCCS